MSTADLTAEENRNRNKLKDEKPLVYEKIIKFAEKYNRGESIAIVQFQYNYQCNFRCQHCSIEPFQNQNKRRLTLADVKRLADQADELGLARFVITGGEPTTFRDLDEVVYAIGPERFFINCDTNGWLLTKQKAEHLKGIGIDRIQLSIDSLTREEHDAFRQMPGSHKRAMAAVNISKEAGLGLFIQTVVTKQRLYSDEFLEFVRYFNAMDVGVFVSYAKPVGAWAGRYDILVTKEDMAYMEELEKEHMLFTHLTPAYGLSMGCIAVKGMFSVTQYGDVLPCPYIHTSLGNVFEEPLKDIIQNGLNIKFFGEHVDTCLIAEDREFIRKYVEGRIYGKELPVPCNEVFSGEDLTKVPFNQYRK